MVSESALEVELLVIVARVFDSANGNIYIYIFHLHANTFSAIYIYIVEKSATASEGKILIPQ